MLISRLFLSADPPILTEEDYEDSPEHKELKERLRKTLYYGRNPKSDRPSLPVTEIAVELLQKVAPRELGRVDEFVASSLSHKASVSPCALMIGLIYIERLKHRNPEYLQKISSSDLFLISMMVASKYLNDEGVEEEVFNDEWSESANMEVADLNELERNFLSAIDWNLFVKETDFRKVLTNIERRVAVRKGKERGYYSYSDLMVLSENHELQLLIREIMLQLSKVVLVCSLAYAASVLTLLGSIVSLGFIQQHCHSVPHPVVSPIFDLSSINARLGLQVSPLSSARRIELSDVQESSVNVVHNSNLSGVGSGENDHGFDTVHRNPDRRRVLEGGDTTATRIGSRNDHDGHDVRNEHRTSSETNEHEKETPKVAASHLNDEAKSRLDVRPQVTFPNFLTLSVIRDTLVQFLLAVRDQRYNQRNNGMETTDDQSQIISQMSQDGDYVCSCGCCHGEVHPRCQNASLDYNPNRVNLLDPCWKIARQEAALESDWVPCNFQQCCCPSMVNLGPWYQLASGANDPLSEIRKGFQTMRLVDAVS